MDDSSHRFRFAPGLYHIKMLNEFKKLLEKVQIELRNENSD
jgi:hypothetical protein